MVDQGSRGHGACACFVGNRVGALPPARVLIDDPLDGHLASFGIERDVDFVAASFVRKGGDVTSIRHFISGTHSKFWPESHPKPLIISKIENLGGYACVSGVLQIVTTWRSLLGVVLNPSQGLEEAFCSDLRPVLHSCNQG